MTRKYQATMSATEKAQQLFGMKGAHSQVANTLSQWMAKAVEKAVNGDERVYENAAKNIRFITDRYTGMITDVATLAFNGIDAPLFNGQYKMTDHSAQRAQERFGMEREEAEKYFNQLLKTAIWQSVTGKRHLYEHKSGARIAVDVETFEIITVYKAEIPTPKLTIDRIADAVKREYKRMRTEVTREINKMKEEYAATGVKIAELKWKQVRCKAPHTKALIQTRIDELVAVTRQITTEIDAKLTQMDAAEAEVKAVVGE